MTGLTRYSRGSIRASSPIHVLREAATKAALGALVLATILGSGCTKHKPVFPDSERIPAHILLPVGAPGVHDSRTRFRDIFCRVLEREASETERGACSDFLHHLIDEDEPVPGPPLPVPQTGKVQMLFVPGLFNGCMEGSLLAYNTAFPALQEGGYSIQRVPISSFGSTDYNADRIAAAWPSLERDPERFVVMVGYSKGAPDILTFLVRHPEIAAEVDAVVTIAGAVNGSPFADDASELAMSLVQHNTPGCDRGDAQSIQSLRRPTRMSWLASHELPDHIHYYTLGVFTDRDNVSRGLLAAYDLLSGIDPRNDGQVLAYDQVVPGSTLLGFANADHWAIAVPMREENPLLAAAVANRPAYPRAVLIESILLFVGEDLSKVRR